MPYAPTICKWYFQSDYNGRINEGAALLCELGRQRARENVVRERPVAYSGMMSYEKAARELPFLGFMFEMLIVVAGVGVSGG